MDTKTHLYKRRYISSPHLASRPKFGKIMLRGVVQLGSATALATGGYFRL